MSFIEIKSVLPWEKILISISKGEEPFHLWIAVVSIAVIQLHGIGIYWGKGGIKGRKEGKEREKEALTLFPEWRHLLPFGFCVGVCRWRLILRSSHLSSNSLWSQSWAQFPGMHLFATLDHELMVSSCQTGMGCMKICISLEELCRGAVCHSYFCLCLCVAAIWKFKSIKDSCSGYSSSCYPFDSWSIATLAGDTAMSGQAQHGLNHWVTIGQRRWSMGPVGVTWTVSTLPVSLAFSWIQSWQVIALSPRGFGSRASQNWFFSLLECKDCWDVNVNDECVCEMGGGGAMFMLGKGYHSTRR
jgi:hypothetical protein